jgi:hypothetical protein
MATSFREVVCVLDSQHLIDSESYQRRYHCRRHLEPGCYIVLWPDSAERLDFDETAEFRGPYSSRRIAEVAARSPDPARPPMRAR